MKPLYTEYCTLTDNTMQLTVPESFNFAYDVVDRIASEEPHRRALVWVQDESCGLYSVTEEHERTVTFAELAAQSSRTAQYLTDAGIRRGDRVMLLLKRHYAYWYILLALHKIGAVAMPTPYMLHHEDLVYRLTCTGASVIICLAEEALCTKTALAAEEVGSVRHLFCIGSEQNGFTRLDTSISSYPAEMKRMETDKYDPLLLYFTSGTTGKPKIVVHDGTYPLAHIQTALLWQNVRDGGLHFSVADTGWAKAAWGKCYGQWLCGSAVMVYDYDVFSAAGMLSVIRTYGVTTFCAPPTIYRFFVKNRLLADGFGAVEYTVTAGEAIHSEIVEQFRAETGLQIYGGYGQTESSLLVAEFRGMKGHPGAMGYPSLLYKPCIVDENGNEVPEEVPGEIVIPAEGRCTVGLCMRSVPGLDMADTVWHGDVYHTGDVAVRTREGYYRFIGRTDDVIKSSGYRISPFEVENVLMRHPSVMECAVTGVPDQERGTVVKATVVLRDGYSADRAMIRELRKFVKECTADYKAPRVVEFVTALPRTFSGKVRHAEIRERNKNM